MMAGADEPATLSGLCQPMAIAMVRGGTSVHGNGFLATFARLVARGASMCVGDSGLGLLSIVAASGSNAPSRASARTSLWADHARYRSGRTAHVAVGVFG